MEPSNRSSIFPSDAVAAQHAAVLCDGSAAVPAVRRDQFHTEMFAHPLIQRIAVVALSPINRSRVSRRTRRWSVVESVASFGGSADHVHGDRKTLAVCDCHDFAAFAGFCRADTRAPFFRRTEAGIDEGFAQIQLPSVA